MKKIRNIFPYWGNCGSIQEVHPRILKIAESLIGTEVSHEWEALRLLEKKFKEGGYRTNHIHEHYNDNNSAKIGWNIYFG